MQRVVRRVAFWVCVAVCASACLATPTPQTFILRFGESTSSPAAPLPGTAGPTVAQAPTNTPVPATAPTSAPEFTPTPLPKCTFAGLDPGIHISSRGSYTETESQAAGPMECQVQRDSCAYHYLVSNLDSFIQYEPADANTLGDEDRMMHPAMLYPLTRLRDLVNAEWGGALKLVVTAAYDSQGHHDTAQPDMSLKYSLHFEGRSMDFITNPPDPSGNRRLCALAWCAGFDWVHNEGTHCHVSLKATSLCTICSGTKSP
jgi:hypothetical protein